MPAHEEQTLTATAGSANAFRKNDTDQPRASQSSNTKIRQNVNRGASSLSSNGTNRHQQHQDHNDGNNAPNFQMQSYNNTNAAHSNAISTGSKQPTPLFERLVTEEVQEIKAYARIIESQQRRLVELERVHVDLEARLEVESNSRKQLETTLEAREREWANKFEELSKDRDQWKGVVQVEQTKNSRLIDQVVRKDQDIHRMLQRKVSQTIRGRGVDIHGVCIVLHVSLHVCFHIQYDHEPIRGSTRNGRQQQSATRDRGERTVTSASRSPEARVRLHKSPHEILAASGSAEKVRLRNVKSLLNDFFGM
jgi:hypothetical protein